MFVLVVFCCSILPCEKGRFPTPTQGIRHDISRGVRRGVQEVKSELRSYDSEEIARSNRALDSGLLDSVIQDIEELPNSLRHESKADTKRSEKELDEILKDLID